MSEIKLPKYYKEQYSLDIQSYKDVPGWINDAEFVYPKMVERAQDGFHFVEIGSLLGQSATHMAQLIKDSGKDIKFDSIDLFWSIKHHIYVSKTEPSKTFKRYIEEMISKWNLKILDIVTYPIRTLDLDDYVNFITCDEIYSYRLYDEASLDFVWIDGDHSKDIVYNDLVNYWPKMKRGGFIGGDDIHYEEVLNDVKKFSEEYNVEVEYNFNSFLVKKS